MRRFDLYEDPDGGTIAVKRGFSWPAFFFTWIWAFGKGLHGPGVALLLGSAAWLAGSRIADGTWLEDLLRVGLLALALWAGAAGNGWRRDALERRGARPTGNAEAWSPRRAVLDGEADDDLLARPSGR